MSRLLGLVSAVAALAMSTNTFADQLLAQQSQSMNNQNCQKKEMGCFEQGCPIPDNKMMKSDMYPKAYSASAAIVNKDGWDLDVGASFIYWYAYQQNMDIAYDQPTFTVGGLDNTAGGSGSFLQQSFSYQPGFKVNGAWNTDYDGWCVGAQYTWLYETQDTDTTAASVQGAISDGWILNDWFASPSLIGSPAGWNGADAAGVMAEVTFADAASKWKMQFNQIDVTVGRPYYHGHHLTVSPSGGVRVVWMKQTMNITMTGGDASYASVAQSLNSQKSWAVGPMFATNAHFNFWKAFRLEGKAGASVLYTNWTSVTHKESTTTLSAFQNTNSSSTDDLSSLTPTVDMGLGIGGGGYFCDCAFFLDAAVRYDFSVLFNQNAMRQFTSILNGSPDHFGDLMMHGLTVDVNFSF
jgi:hypothetical protein